MRFRLAAACALLVGATAARAQQPLDTAYTRQIRASTSEPRFNTDLTDHLPADPRVPTPLQVLGYVPGTVGHLSHVADLNRYFRALAASSPRIRLFEAGRSDEGRDVMGVEFERGVIVVRHAELHCLPDPMAGP